MKVEWYTKDISYKGMWIAFCIFHPFEDQWSLMIIFHIVRKFHLSGQITRTIQYSRHSHINSSEMQMLIIVKKYYSSNPELMSWHCCIKGLSEKSKRGWRVLHTFSRKELSVTLAKLFTSYAWYLGRFEIEVAGWWWQLVVVADGGQRIFCHLGHQGGRLATTMQCRYISYKIYSPIMNISLFQDTWIENARNDAWNQQNLAWKKLMKLEKSSKKTNIRRFFESFM